MQGYIEMYQFRVSIDLRVHSYRINSSMDLELESTK